MIALHSGALNFETSDGDVIPCSAEEVTLELMGEAAKLVDPQVVRQAACAVLHYFKEEMGKTQVSIGEFSQALARVLRGFGLDVREGDTETSEVETPAEPRVAEADLSALAAESEEGFELVFFHRLRAVLHDKLRDSPAVVRFVGLRGCVKQLAGARRWCDRCQRLNDQIVDYLRCGFRAERTSASCALVVL